MNTLNLWNHHREGRERKRSVIQTGPWGNRRRDEGDMKTETE